MGLYLELTVCGDGAYAQVSILYIKRIALVTVSFGCLFLQRRMRISDFGGKILRAYLNLLKNQKVKAVTFVLFVLYCAVALAGASRTRLNVIIRYGGSYYCCC